MTTCGHTQGTSTCQRLPHTDPYHAQVVSGGKHISIWPAISDLDEILAASALVRRELLTTPAQVRP